MVETILVLRLSWAYFSSISRIKDTEVCYVMCKYVTLNWKKQIKGKAEDEGRHKTVAPYSQKESTEGRQYVQQKEGK